MPPKIEGCTSLPYERHSDLGDRENGVRPTASSSKRRYALYEAERPETSQAQALTRDMPTPVPQKMRDADPAITRPQSYERE